MEVTTVGISEVWHNNNVKLAFGIQVSSVSHFHGVICSLKKNNARKSEVTVLWFTPLKIYLGKIPTQIYNLRKLRNKHSIKATFYFDYSGDTMDVFDAAERYKQTGTPLIVLAGKEYGSGEYCCSKA